MTVDLSSSTQDFLNAAAAKQPTPGGGAVSALSAALACSMLEMVLNYSVNKKGLEAHHDTLKSALAAATETRTALQSLVVADQTAYLGLTATRKLPPETPDRDAQILSAVTSAITVPRDIATHSLKILELADQVVDIANPYLLSDLAVSADLAMASLRSAIYNVRINLPDLKDPAGRTAAETSNSTLLYKATQLIQKTSPRIWTRIRQSQTPPA